MSLKTLETAILFELRRVSGKRTLRKKDIMEWSTSPVEAHDGETLFVLPELKIHIAVLTAALGKNWLRR